MFATRKILNLASGEVGELAGC